MLVGDFILVLSSAYRIVGNLCMVQNFAVFVDSSASTEIKNFQSSARVYYGLSVGVVSLEHWHKIKIFF